MKVLIFSTAYLPHIGGAEVAVKEITDRLGDLSFVMITARLDSSLPKHERVGTVDVHRIGFGSWVDKFLLPVVGLWKAKRLHKNEHFTLAWAIMASQSAIAAAFFATLSKIPLVLTLQEGDEEDHLKRYVGGNDFLYKMFIRPWYRLAFTKATRITAISSYLKGRAQKEVKDTPVDIVPNGVQADRFINAEKKESAQLGIESNHKIIITTSRLVEKNAVGDLIKATALLPRDTHLVIAGEGKLKDELVALAKERQVEDRVHFLGTIPQTDIPMYVKMADVFCRPSLSEGQGVSFLEAMAAGVPMIATPVGGIPDFLMNGDTGWFCEVKNPKSIAEKVQYILDEKNEENVSRVVEKAQRLVKEKYSWDGIAEQMKHVFKKFA